MNRDYKKREPGRTPAIPQKTDKNKSSGTKRVLTPREKAILAERKRIEIQKRNKAIRAFIDKAVAVGVFALIGAVIAIAVIFGYIYFDFSSSPNAPDKNVHVSYSKEDIVTLPENEYFYRNGEYFVSLTSLCKICPMTLHGNIETITLSLSDDVYATFNIGTETVNICGTNSVLSNPAYFENGAFFAPVSFFTQFCEGVRCEYPEKGDYKGLNLIFDKSFTFKTTPISHLSPINDGTVTTVADGSNFKADLSSYEMYMNPENKDDFLIIAGNNNLLPREYAPQNLIDVSFTRNDGRQKEQMDFYAGKALEAMFLEMRANGFNDVYVTVGYRSYDYYKELLANKTEELTPIYGDLASEYARLEVSYPGSDEHQTGLCADLHNLSSESEKFATEASYKWLFSNCAEFGFILRYPKDKTDITGKDFSPWHFRYVGRYHAKEIMSQGLCLEEYLDNL